MTGHEHQHISSLVTDLVTMAEATRRLPEIERELAEARQRSQSDGDTIARLEIKLQQRANEIDELNSKLRSVEVERDDASFRVLDTEDTALTLQRSIEGVLSSLGETLGVVTGDGHTVVQRMSSAEQTEWANWQEEQRKRAEAERIAAERPIEPSSLQSPAEAPTTGSIDSSQGGNSPSEASEPSPSTSDPMGQSELPPTTASDSQASSSQTAGTGDVQSPVDATTGGRYSGKSYAAHPFYVSRQSWIDGGGSAEDYDSTFRTA